MKVVVASVTTVLLMLWSLFLLFVGTMLGFALFESSEKHKTSKKNYASWYASDYRENSNPYNGS